VHYSELTWRRFSSAAAAGALDGANVRRGAAGSIAGGTWVQFDVRLGGGPPTAPIAAVRFRAFGCPHVIAVADWVAEASVGRPAVPQLPESIQALQERFAVPVEKLGRLLILEDAWIAAMSSPYT